MATRYDGQRPVDGPVPVGAVARAGWGWVLAIGILTLIAGIVMLGEPTFTTLAATIFAGWLLLALGVVGIVVGLRSRRATGRVWEIATGLLSVVAGLYLILQPVAGAITLTLAVAIWLAVRGVMWLVAAIRGRSRHRPLMIFNGVVDLLLATMLFAGFPYPAVGFIGIAIGISLIFGGVSTIMAAFALRQAA